MMPLWGWLPIPPEFAKLKFGLKLGTKLGVLFIASLLAPKSRPRPGDEDDGGVFRDPNKLTGDEPNC